MVLEILSDSTRDFDPSGRPSAVLECARGDKLERYKTIPSLRHVVLVDQHSVDVEVWTRGPAGWTRRVLTDEADVLRLEAPAVEIGVGELYAGSERLPS